MPPRLDPSSNRGVDQPSFRGFWISKMARRIVEDRLNCVCRCVSNRESQNKVSDAFRKHRPAINQNAEFTVNLAVNDRVCTGFCTTLRQRIL